MLTASLRLAVEASSGLEKAEANTATTNKLMRNDTNNAIAAKNKKYSDIINVLMINDTKNVIASKKK